MIKYTIVIPTYNRLNLLQRSINFIEKINYDRTQFELIVVDDGSIDGTAEFLEKYESLSLLLNYRYFIKPNNGKYSAVRLAAVEAKGEYFLVTDSDDYLDSEILNKVDTALEYCNGMSDSLIAGVIGLNYNISSEKIQGNDLKNNLFLSDPIEMRFNNNKYGDEIKIIKTKLFKEFNFPKDIKDVKFVPESYVYYGLCSKYKFIYTNEVLQYIEYQEDGLTNTIESYRIKNSFGCYLAYKKYIDLIDFKKSRKGYIRNYINYIRFALHSKSQMNFFNFKTILLFSAGVTLYLYDLKRSK